MCTRSRSIPWRGRLQAWPDNEGPRLRLVAREVPQVELGVRQGIIKVTAVAKHLDRQRVVPDQGQVHLRRAKFPAEMVRGRTDTTGSAPSSGAMPMCSVRSRCL